MVKLSKKAILPLGNMAKLVFWSKITQKLTLSNLSFLWSEGFLREREEIFSTYSGPDSEQENLKTHSKPWPG